MLGADCCGPRVRGAFGFSNDKSLVYWARTENLGPACGASAPLPFWSAIVNRSSSREPERLLAVLEARPSAPRGRLAWRRYPNKRGRPRTSRRRADPPEQRKIGVAVGPETIALLIGAHRRARRI